ncbi:Acg family FMN-binding oxidoreductase [Kitasatospora camelliae]|uniref:Nitroreductase family protein n=1 Tax=Kitasatospora camelliae TaxID=3156397 RepID=A0AAU8JP28_9ACTN
MAEPALTLDQLKLLATAAGAAPSVHNSQPWRLRPTPDARGMLVFGDPERAVAIADPMGRALHVSVGAAVFNLRVGAGRLGRAASVSLLPDPADPHLLAEIGLDEPAARHPFGHHLYPAIRNRHSSRQPFTNRDIPETVLGELIEAARQEEVVLSPLEEDGVLRVLRVTAEAERRTAADLARQAETRSWLRLEAPASDGIPAAALGPQDRDARVPMRDFTAGRPDAPAAAPRHFEPLPQLCLLITQTDQPADWLRTGQALEHVWLLATVHGLRASVLHQAVEWPETRWRLRDPEDPPHHVQLMLRLGYGPPGPATPRRPIEEILDLTDYHDNVGYGESSA